MHETSQEAILRALWTRRRFIARTGAAAIGLGVAPSLLRGGHAAGRARALVSGRELRLGTRAVEARWSLDDGALRAVSVRDLAAGRVVRPAPDLFTLTLPDGSTLASSALRVAGEPREERLRGDPSAPRLAERLAGRALTAELTDPDGRLGVTWRALARDGTAYIRQELELRAVGGELAVSRIRLVDLGEVDARVVGSVRGSPIVAGSMFFAFEHPLSESDTGAGRARAALPRELPLRPDAPFRVSAVAGTTPAGQLRRGFLDYVEHERAHPYRTFLHYNSWYDLGYFTKYDEAGALDRIHAFGTQLHERRGVALSSFLFDDGWDDPSTLWHFHSGFPGGLTRVREAAARYGAAPGVWLSPWGGYGEPRKRRLEHGREQGFETNDGGFALSGPRYYQRFRETCLDMIRRYGVNQFKIDGTGNAAHAIPGSRFDSDFDAAIHLIGELRDARPDLYINLTTGTYPSPFWLRWADSIWRGGEDHDFAGVGSDRQRWITYRDAATHEGVVRRGPLFPLSSLMLHGMIYARYAKKLGSDPNDDFRDEVRSYFGTGTQLQEMYITPALLSDDDWDHIARSAKWSRERADTLRDTHWVGGDPGALEPYGWASWSPERAVLVLRNPKDAPQTLELDVAEAFELPEGTSRRWQASDTWDREAAPLELRTGQPHAFALRPFQVLTLDVSPA